LSNNALPQWIDQLKMKDHTYLDSNDQCLFFTEFYSGHGFAGSGNQLITNLKIKPSEKHRHQHKKNAIDKCADLIINGFGLERLEKCLLIPIPPSKEKNDPEYDDRLIQILLAIQEKGKQNSFRIDFHELFSTIKSRKQTSTLKDKKPNPVEHMKNWNVNHSLLKNIKHENILILDDVITTGSQFKATKKLILQTIPQCNVYGIFIARRVPSEIE
jgi:predicted amidophosphoribosyltransferase